ncbi:olfactory receptor 6N1-like [Rhinatrema bivittatum]|uniref:olfactory receptor 6N1-like n=1 Tax=Rhinatrema bivittatum TaxID=194408 RepID=UPI0011273A29|nr:olfactory receptor 6N1-like [Rhinatrema bivittatum]
MEIHNQTMAKYFLILGFSSFHQFQNLLFFIILLVYLTILTGNLSIIMLVKVEISLHSPMYFFISSLSVLEILYVSVIVPKLLLNLLAVSTSISYAGCFVQLYTFHSLGITECVLLGVMAFDRYLAICNPLRYETIMTKKFCIQLAACSWLLGFSAALIPTILAARLLFCGQNEINHFFCDLAPLLNLACTDISFNIVVNSSVAGCAAMIPFSLIIVFYINIIIAVLKIKTEEGRHKAFSTCSSHLIVVILFYGSALIVYVRPKGSFPVDYDKLLSLTYAVFTPLFNPFIYSLRNNNVKEAARKLYRHHFIAPEMNVLRT